MTWNWQHPDWPRFRWQSARLVKAEERFILASGVLMGMSRHLSGDRHEQLVVETLSREALTTSTIEGEVLDRESVRSSIRRALGLSHDRRRAGASEQGIAELTVDVYRTPGAGLDHATLFAWHRMVTRGRGDLADVGTYRTHAEPMRIVSGQPERPKVHFEAPPSERVPGEMDRFIEWFNQTGPGSGGSGGTSALPALTRAGIAHAYFESIHPFEDGNGRIGRAIAERALAQSLSRPTLTALAATILLYRRAYYDALHGINQDLDLTEWLAWFAGITLEAQRRTLAEIEFLIDKSRYLDTLRGSLNPRQEKALLCMFREGPDGFAGGLSAGNYVAITAASPATARRDLRELVDRGALSRTGQNKSARYHLTIPLRPTPRISIDPHGEIVESTP
jgi:Fic family protein